MRSANKDVRVLADQVFVALLMGDVKLKNPEFQEFLEAKIAQLLKERDATRTAP